MLVKILSNLTGKYNTMNIPIDMNQLSKLGQKGADIEAICPELDQEEKLFLLEGITPEEWEANLGSDKDINNLLNKT
jgi:hypothetical protein